jgi:hypothetical protein
MGIMSWTFLNPIIAAMAALFGVWIGGYLTDRREREKRRTDFITRQLTEFYGPLVAARAEILARSELRVKVQRAAGDAWQELTTEAGGGFEGRLRVSPEQRAAFSALLDYDNASLRETLLPAYRQMVTIFREKWSLGEPKTRSHFPALVEFVEVWERHLKGGIPGEALEALGHSEENLKPLYRNLEQTHDRLRDALSGQARR